MAMRVNHGIEPIKSPPGTDRDGSRPKLPKAVAQRASLEASWSVPDHRKPKRRLTVKTVAFSTPNHSPSHPIAAYVYSDDRKNERPAGHLAGFRGVLQVDGYDGFKKLADNRADASVRLAFCWIHMRRYFYEFYVSTKSPLAGEVLARIRQLYAIEAEIRGHPAEHRQQGSWRRSLSGCRISWARSPARPIWPRRSATPSAIGTAWWCSSMTVASRWTPMWWSGPSASAP
jgi:Transposase IS66 family